ncbi:MAG: type I pullulanase [Prolixibacteraceae bacterium]|jgi:pullulanase|nr:type I pullulanase [Prolixibacteraceae bacterium]
MRNWKFNHIDFSVYPFYDGGDLGVFFSEGHLSVKIWAPTARSVEFRIYENSTWGHTMRVENLMPSENGTWSLWLKGNFKNLYYTLKVDDGEPLDEVPDMYARAVGTNGKRGLIFDPAETHPEDWENDRPVSCENPVDAIIYELHVRDFSVDPASGFLHKGKFLAFTEDGLVNAFGEKIGIAHLRELGITHVHLLPVNDFYSVDEANPGAQYNWGYDPLHYNAPEGSYSGNPDNLSRIIELKKLVQSLHRNGIGAILDVVYNHTGYTRRSVFNQTVPGYFYRQNRTGGFANASGCGNEIASERAMVRKYIADSLCYWAREYHVDGFRFDLMGIFDIETMNHIRAKLDEINPSIILYGEGWTADKSPLDEKYRAVKKNVSRLNRIAVFNDDLRDALKGNNFDGRSKGFASGLTLREEQLKFGMVAACFHPQITYHFVESSDQPWAMEPWQCVNYVSCHDNYTLFDKLALSSPGAGEEELRRMICLAGAIILTSQGIPFLHAGSEMARTKKGDHNSYKSPDSINKIEWDRKSQYRDVFNYFRQLIELRKHHPAFRMRSSDQIRHHFRFSKYYHPGVVACLLTGHANGDPWKEIWLIFNGNKSEVDYPVPENKQWKVVARGLQMNNEGIENFSGGQVKVPAVSMMILVTE